MDRSARLVNDVGTESTNKTTGHAIDDSSLYAVEVAQRCAGRATTRAGAEGATTRSRPRDRAVAGAREDGCAAARGARTPKKSHSVLFRSLTRRRTAAVTCAVLVQAARHRAARGVIFHSDRGSEYMGAPFCAQVAQVGLLQSASARGPGDNAHAESFFHSLKAKLTRGVTFPTARALHRALRTYIATTTQRAFTRVSTTSRHLPLNGGRRKP